MNHQTRALLVLHRVATQRHRSRRPSNKCLRAVPCPRRTRLDFLWATKSPRRPPEAAGSLKPGTDEPPNEGAARAAPGRHAAPPKPPPLKQMPQGCSMPAPYTPDLLWATKSPRRPPEAAGSLKPGTDEPPNEGAARAAPGRHAAPLKPSPLKQTPQGCSMLAPCTPGPVVGRQVPTAPPRGRRLAKTRYR